MRQYNFSHRSERWFEAHADEWEHRRIAVLACKLMVERKHGRAPLPEELTRWLGDTVGMSRPDPRVDHQTKRARAPRGRYNQRRTFAAIHRVSTFDMESIT